MAGCSWGHTPKLLGWVNFKNFGFKVNLVTKLYLSETNVLPNNVNGDEFVKGSLHRWLYILQCVPPQKEEVQKKYRRSTRKGEAQHVKVLNI